MRYITTGEQFHAPEIQMNPRTIAAFFVLLITGGRVQTPTAQQIASERAKAWREHAAKIQKELNAERLNGFGFRAIDGRRIDF